MEKNMTTETDVYIVKVEDTEDGLALLFKDVDMVEKLGWEANNILLFTKTHEGDVLVRKADIDSTVR